ncbi:ABC transporter permease [Kibdelosporangium phytohabitans]|uniref:Nitrate ABC transporter permease n=1 Tax=Kibdelosporangium phytohabitans TaxID=860235 RepID=A0A0N7F2J4_9PSEU|nr:ABC transporter permease [Kibdelosporangium phytohabitans]ALG05999.1 nitrate ABC transporter permease [Kibdelosporangium phytohabitans]MBE1465936.1 ABC-type nitrate/sulfonate/bicarbonate transport system permease component [Kibdelosporangium phytohabitans]
MTHLRGFAQRWIVFIGVLAAWQLLTMASGSKFFPTPLSIVEAAGNLWLGGPASQLWLHDNVFVHVLPSLGRLLTGWLGAAVVGIALGIALGRSKNGIDYFGPLFAFLRSIPPVLLLPFFMVIFGIESPQKIALIAFGALWPILLNSVDGARSVDAVKTDTARSFRIPRTQWITMVVLPAALPKIFAGLRVSLSLSLVLMVISELVGAATGMGTQLTDAQRQYDYPNMWAVIVLLGVLGFVLNNLLLAVERRVLSWQPTRNAQVSTVKAGG